MQSYSTSVPVTAKGVVREAIYMAVWICIGLNSCNSCLTPDPSHIPCNSKYAVAYRLWSHDISHYYIIRILFLQECIHRIYMGEAC